MSCPPPWGVPLSRLSTADMVREAQRNGIVAMVSDKTVWRWLHEDAIRPWQHRTWIFPRDPDFGRKAGRILVLYARCWEGRPLSADDFVLSADEKTSIQARLRKHPSTPPSPWQPDARRTRIRPRGRRRWSLTSVQRRLVKTGEGLVKHARYYWLLLAESHLTRRLFAAMFRRIWTRPAPAGLTGDG